MTATRYSGKLTVRMTYLDSEAQYRCVVSYSDANGSGWTTLYVRPPALLRNAVDSPIAFDETAHAALSFASEDHDWVERYADFNDGGWAINRKDTR
jgi:hypothetical protein